MLHREPNEPDIPKSDGEKRRLIIGVRANTMAWATAVPVITIKTFLTKEDFLSQAGMFLH